MISSEIADLKPVFDSVNEELSRLLGSNIKLIFQKRINRTLSTVVFFSVNKGGRDYRFILKRCIPSEWDAAIKGRTISAEYEVLCDLYEKFERFNGGSVPKPVLFLPEHDVLVMEAYELPSLLSDMKCLRHFSPRRPFVELQKMCVHTGAWLKHLQDISLTQKDSLNVLAPITEECQGRIDEIDNSGSDMVPTDFSVCLADQLESYKSQLSGKEVPVCGVHGDFSPQNILHSPERIVVIDLFTYHEGPVCYDVIDFLLFLKIRTRSPIQSRKRIDALMNSFMVGYGEKKELPEALSALLEFQLRIRNLYYMIFPEPDTTWNRPYVRKAIVKSHLKWFYNQQERDYLW